MMSSSSSFSLIFPCSFLQSVHVYPEIDLLSSPQLQAHSTQVCHHLEHFDLNNG